MNNNGNAQHITQDQVNRYAYLKLKSYDDGNFANDFILPEDPLFKYHPVFCPHRICNTCGHNKYYLEYVYKRWDTGPKRMSHFGILRCDKCGTAITWVNKHLRDAVIKKNNLNIAAVD